jgi:hypothetical protein
MMNGIFKLRSHIGLLSGGARELIRQHGMLKNRLGLK